MKVFFNCGLEKNSLEGYEIFSNDCRPYLNGVGRPSELIFGGLQQYLRKNNLRNPEAFDELYRTRNKGFINFIEDTIEICRECDVVILSAGVDMLPPEIIKNELKNKYKVQFYVDDPHTTLSYGTPFAFAFDAAIYISKNYSAHSTMRQFLNYVGFSKQHLYHLPLCASNRVPMQFSSPEELLDRSGSVYIGQYYGSKAERLKYLKSNLKDEFKVYGRWPFKGMISLFSILNGKNNFIFPVHSVSSEAREQIYLKSAVGFNLHQSENPTIENGNVRTYELPWFGIAQVLDRPSLPENELPFVPEKEALYYENINEAKELISFLLANENYRAELAYNGYKRALKDYAWESVIKSLFLKIEKNNGI